MMNGRPESRPVEEPSTASRSAMATPPDTIVVRQSTRTLLRWVYTSNPFYALSAALFFWGLWSSCRVEDYWAIKTVTLTVGLGAYTLVLAVATLLVVRWGKVWEDGRSLLLLIVLMLLGMSVSFDDALTGHFRIGVLCCLGGLAFAVAVSESLLRGLGLRFGVWLRLPYYLVLTLFFLYPVGLGAMDQRHPAVPWVVLAFPTAAGVVLLSLLPAIRKGPQYVRDNGSPWPWPWFPWTLFAFLALAVGPRSYYLAVSMHQVGGLTTIFAPYFLVPLAFAAGILLLEIGMVTTSPRVQRLALLAPLTALALASIACADEETALKFLADFKTTLGGTPLHFTLLLTAGFYAWAALRRVHDAIDAITATLLALVFVSPQTYGIDTLSHPRAVPVLFAAVAQAVAAKRQPGSQRCFLAACCLIAAATITWQDTWFTAWEGFLPRHLLVGMMLLMSLAFKDRLARFLEYSAAIALVGYGSSAALGISLGIGPVPTSVAATYPAFAIAAALAIGRLLGNRLHYALAAITVACWGFGRGGSVYERVHRTLPGLPYLIAAAAAFAFALLISLVKAGNARRLPSVQDPQGGPDDRGDAAFEAPCRRVGQWGYLALVGLYRMFSLAGIVLIAVGFPPGPLWEMWLPHDVALFVSHHCVEVAVLATLVALALGLCIGVVRLAFAMRPSRSLRWYFIANVLVLAGVLFTLPAVH